MEQNIYGYNPRATDRVQNTTLGFSALMTKVYVWMTLAIVTTGLTSFYVVNNEDLLFSINPGIFWGLTIAELALVWILSANIMRMSFPIAGLMFLAYSILNGVNFSVLFLVYTAESLTTTFMVTAGTFGAMSLVGMFIKKDLSSIGRFLFMALIGLIIGTLVNMFVASSALEWALTYAGIAIFCGLTAYDTQKMKEILQQKEQAGDTNLLKIALLCSLSLYLDFINLFIYLLPTRK